MNGILLIAIVGLFSVLAFWKKNAAMFMVLFAVSVPVGLALPDVISSAYSTNGLDMALALMFILYGFLCAGWSIRLLSTSQEEI